MGRLDIFHAGNFQSSFYWPRDAFFDLFGFAPGMATITSFIGTLICGSLARHRLTTKHQQHRPVMITAASARVNERPAFARPVRGPVEVAGGMRRGVMAVLRASIFRWWNFMHLHRLAVCNWSPPPPPGFRGISDRKQFPPRFELLAVFTSRNCAFLVHHTNAFPSRPRTFPVRVGTRIADLGHWHGAAKLSAGNPRARDRECTETCGWWDRDRRNFDDRAFQLGVIAGTRTASLSPRKSGPSTLPAIGSSRRCAILISTSGRPRGSRPLRAFLGAHRQTAPPRGVANRPPMNAASATRNCASAASNSAWEINLSWSRISRRLNSRRAASRNA